MTEKKKGSSELTVNRGRQAIAYTVMLFHIVVAVLVYCNMASLFDYIVTWIFGSILAAIELSTKYKDDPASVLASSPGLLYLGINGLLCIFSLFLMEIFDLGIQLEDPSQELAQRTMDVLQASLASFFVMRSSFLKLGHDSQIDLGLNSVMKKLLEIVDREVDRVRAVKRSKDITTLFQDVCHTNTRYIFDLCLSVMQNVSTGEAAQIQRKLDKLESYIGSESKSLMDLNGMQLEIGLELYNIVGISVLRSAVEDLKLIKSAKNADDKQGERSNLDPSDPEILTKFFLSQIKFRGARENKRPK